MSDQSITSAELMKSEAGTDEAAEQAGKTEQRYDQDLHLASAVYWNRVNQYRSRMREAPAKLAFSLTA
jgi:hypothetical protein